MQPFARATLLPPILYHEMPPALHGLPAGYGSSFVSADITRDSHGRRDAPPDRTLDYLWDNLINFGMGPRKGPDGKLALTMPMDDKKLPGVAAAYPAYPSGISFNWVDTPWGGYQPMLINTRINYSFSARIFWGALIQYNSGDNALSTNLRFRWEYKPGSDKLFTRNNGHVNS